MIRRVEIDDGRGERRLGADAFPLGLGGPGADVELPGTGGETPVAFLGLDEGELFIQPGEGGPVTVEGTLLQTSRWLRDGDQIAAGGGRVEVALESGGLRLKVTEARALGAGPGLTPPERGAAEGPVIRPAEFRPGSGAGRGRERRPWRPVGLLLALVFALLVGGAYFVLTAQPVALEIAPEPETLEIRGALFAPELGERRLLRPGDYTLVATKTGYRPLEEAFTVDRGSDQSFAFELEKLPGHLAVSARDRADGTAIEGATLTVDGTEVDRKLPIAELELAPGPHEVRIRAESYAEFVDEIEIEGGGELQTLVAELDSRWAPIAFSSAPAGAEVRVDGKRLGRTPLEAEIFEGRHAVEFALAGHRIARLRLDVEAGQPGELEVRLELADGQLELASEPAGAAVSIDGTFRGSTPLDVELPPNRDYELKWTKAGHESQVRTVRLEPGEKRRLEVDLDAREGEVKIAAWPPDAELRVDGEPRGKANQTLVLTAVAHEIEIRKDGFKSFRQRVTPLPGVAQTLEVRLESTTPEPAALPPVVTTSEGHELRLVRPGKFELGAPRREPGRRANEVERQVELTRAFYLGRNEVTNEQFREFRSEHLSGGIGGHNLEIDHHPAVRVSWEDAVQYCNWLSRKESIEPFYVRDGTRWVPAKPRTRGYRLPTEAEWAWAARYAGGAGEALKYPWGGSLPVSPESGNYGDGSAAGLLPRVLPDYRDGHPTTAPVGSFGTDRLGFADLGGNVAEWVHDRYGLSPPGSAVERDPVGPDEGEFHVIRGSSWMHATITELRLSFRDYGRDGRPDVGFRIARDAE